MRREYSRRNIIIQITCSGAIMKYLVDQYAKDDSLYPKDPKKGALVCQRQLFVATYLFPRFGAYFVSVFQFVYFT